MVHCIGLITDVCDNDNPADSTTSFSAIILAVVILWSHSCRALVARLACTQFNLLLGHVLLYSTRSAIITCNKARVIHTIPLHLSWQNDCRAEEEKAAAEAEAALAAREDTPEVSEEGEILVDPEELEEISKAQQQAVSKQAHPHHPAPKQASDRGRDRDRSRGADRDKGHPGRDRQALFFLCEHPLH